MKTSVFGSTEFRNLVRVIKNNVSENSFDM